MLKVSVVAGLGNAGERYHGTRHNVGFRVVDELARGWRLRWTAGRAARTACGTFARQIVVLVQPQLFMNRSGEALAELDVVHTTGKLIVVHDEIDLPAGCLRVKAGGGTAGHRGIASVAAHYGPEFTRIRVGIGRPERGTDVVEHVMQSFTPDEENVIEAAIPLAGEAVKCVLEFGDRAAMQRFNNRQAGMLLPQPASGNAIEGA